MKHIPRKVSGNNTKLSCNRCGKTDFDDSKGCYSPVIHTPAVGDWSCTDIAEKPVFNIPKELRRG